MTLYLLSIHSLSEQGVYDLFLRRILTSSFIFCLQQSLSKESICIKNKETSERYSQISGFYLFPLGNENQRFMPLTSKINTQLLFFISATLEKKTTAKLLVLVHSHPFFPPSHKLFPRMTLILQTQEVLEACWKPANHLSDLLTNNENTHN